MASGHGIPRVSENEGQSAESKQLQQKKIDKYLALVSQVNGAATAGRYDQESLSITSKLLSENPEYYTIWNFRRRILIAQIEQLLPKQATETDASYEDASRLFTKDLLFLVPLLQKFPKCYWLWNHRSWLLTEVERRLPIDVAIQFWTEELGLVSKMLGRDSRNFHAWGYRRKTVSELERLDKKKGGPGSMAEKEFEYTRTMIGKDLSNFSAWHARSKLLSRIATEKNAGDVERKDMLEKEIELIHEALIDPQDQSLWYYHQFLMTTFDPNHSADSIAPALSTDDRLQYLQNEIDYIAEVLEDAENVKWVYLALIEVASLYNTLSDKWPDGAGPDKISQWINRLQQLDPARKARWKGMASRAYSMK